MSTTLGDTKNELLAECEAAAKRRTEMEHSDDWTDAERAVLLKMAQKGGRQKTKAKVAASRVNGMEGGRPTKPFVVKWADGAYQGTQAISIEVAATQAGRGRYGARAIVLRTTGTKGKSGWFQTYRKVRGSGGMTSHGHPFHVS